MSHKIGFRMVTASIRWDFKRSTSRCTCRSVSRFAPSFPSKAAAHCFIWPSDEHSLVVGRTEEKSGGNLRYGAAKPGSCITKKNTHVLCRWLTSDYLLTANPHRRSVEDELRLYPIGALKAWFKHRKKHKTTATDLSMSYPRVQSCQHRSGTSEGSKPRPEVTTYTKDGWYTNDNGWVVEVAFLHSKLVKAGLRRKN